MRWNPFRRATAEVAADSVFETTMVDDAALARLAGAAALRSAVGPGPGVGPDAPAANDDRDAPPAPETPPAAEDLGRVGRYALKTVLGRGGLGTVYAAWDPLLSRTVALKTLHLDADPAARDALDALFLNEARAAAGLSHPHIVTVFDAGPSEQGVYIAMERLQGQDLRALLAEGARPDPIAAANIVRRVADALAYAHRKGVVHCDIKPANIFMTGRQHPKVLDFGIARIAHREAAPALEGALAGSPYYLAPEQLDGRSVDRRSDVYALGVVLYELLTGRKPFEGESLEAIAQAVRGAEVAPAHRVAPKVPLGLSTIAARAMARAADQRYPSARHLSMELRHWADSAEARALRDAPRGGDPRPPAGLRVVRIALPVMVAMALGAVWLARHVGRPTAADLALEPPSALAPAAATPAASTPAPLAASGATATAAPGPEASAAATPTAMPAAMPAAMDASPAPAAAAVPAPPPSAAVDPAKAVHRRKPASAGEGVPPTAAAATGVVHLAVSPWGQVEVDGRPLGTSPPLTRLTLAPGTHSITVRNADFPAYTQSVTVSADAPATVRHRFGP